MDITPAVFGRAHPIESYGPAGFRVGGQLVAGPCIIHPGGARAWGGLADRDALLALAGEVDVILLGTGGVRSWPGAGLREALDEVGIGIEAMTSRAACRTYNILLIEQRRVAAALLPLGDG